MSKQKGYFQDETTWGELSRVSAKRGITISDLIEGYCLRGLSKEQELTATERYFVEKRNINLTLDGIFSTFSMTVEGSLDIKIRVLVGLCTGISVQSPLRNFRKLAELSLYTVLNDIRFWDIDIYNEIMKEMSKYKRTKQAYLSIYPEIEQSKKPRYL